MTDISVIILVGKEKIHMRRCMEKLAPLEPRQIFVIESQPPDGTREIAESFGARVVFHAWPGTQAEQFNWALDYVEGKRGLESSGWILRLDADEYLTPETIEKLKQFLSSTSTSHFDSSSDSIAGLTLELKRKFCGGEIRHATNGIRQVRLFRCGKARYAETLMDERLLVGEWVKGEWVEGRVDDFDGAFYDDSLMPMDEWREKHRKYAKREAEQALAGTFQDPRKAKYYKLPRYFRAFVYFGIRYFLKGGFLDGYAGWMWNFWQGLWYRLLVDREIRNLANKV